MGKKKIQKKKINNSQAKISKHNMQQASILYYCKICQGE